MLLPNRQANDEDCRFDSSTLPDAFRENKWKERLQIRFSFSSCLWAPQENESSILPNLLANLILTQEYYARQLQAVDKY